MRGRRGFWGRSRIGLRSETASIWASWIRHGSLILIVGFFGCAGTHSDTDGPGSPRKRTQDEFSGARVLETARALSVPEHGDATGCTPVSKPLRARLHAMGAYFVR